MYICQLLSTIIVPSHTVKFHMSFRQEAETKEKLNRLPVLPQWQHFDQMFTLKPKESEGFSHSHTSLAAV